MKEARFLIILLIVFSLFSLLTFAQLPDPPAPPDDLNGDLPSDPCPPGETACTSSDWSSTISPSTCPSSGSQTKTWTSSKTCSCGVTHPATETISCTYSAPSSGGSGGGSSSSSSGSSSSSSSSSVCSASNWNSTISPSVCPSSGLQVKTWTKIRTCSGGITHPAKENISCTYSAPSTQSSTQQPVTEKKQSSQSNIVEEAQSASNTSFYIVTAIFAVLFVIALVFAISKLKKKVPVQTQIVNPQIMQLKSYISDNLSKGYSREQITNALIQAGYSQQIINEAMKIAP